MSLPFGTQVIDENLLYSLKEIVIKMCSPDLQGPIPESFYGRFPGSKPVSMYKRDLPFLKQKKYWVCEKSDGVRAMVLLMENGIYFVDLMFNFWHISIDEVRFPTRKNLNANHNKTLLDGEIVFNHHYQKYCFMIFDIIACNQQRKIGKLEERLSSIWTELVEPWRKLYREDMYGNLPFIPMGKLFFPVESVDKVLCKIEHHEDKEGHRYIYRDKNRYNENDGVVFTPDDYEYKAGKAITTKKWKWPKINTVDFLIKVENEKKYENQRNPRQVFKLYLMGQKQVVPYRQVHFDNKCVTRLLDDLAQIEKREAIVECSYIEGDWRYHRLRQDKDKPNYYSVVLQIMESIIDNVTVEELRRELAAKKPVMQKPTTNEPSPVTTEVVYSTPPEKTPQQNPGQTPEWGKKRNLEDVGDVEERPLKRKKVEE